MVRNPYTPPTAEVQEQLDRSQGIALLSNFAALLLLVGGLVGTAMFALTIARADGWGNATYILATGLIVLFVISAVVGLRIWRRRAGGVVFAIGLFLLQTPIVDTGGFSYQYFTGLSANLLHGPGGTNLTFSAGATATLTFGGEPDRFIWGINLVALVMCLLLFFLARPDTVLERSRET